MTTKFGYDMIQSILTRLEETGLYSNTETELESYEYEHSEIIKSITEGESFNTQEFKDRMDTKDFPSNNIFQAMKRHQQTPQKSNKDTK